MCDTLVLVTADGVWLAKNSDREPDEVQLLEHHPGASHAAGAYVQLAHLAVPLPRVSHALWISRPRWMWGIEMGVNERGLAIANEAVFVRPRLGARGVTGMDLQRLALAQAGSAAEALALMIEMLAVYPQGGRMGFADAGMRYSSSFILADAREAWVLETAGELWAAQRVVGARTLSNVLTIADDFDQIHPQAYATARARGWCQNAADFGFASAFGRPFYRVMSGGEGRLSCTRAGLGRVATGAVDVAAMAGLLRDHGGMAPSAGLRMHMPCAHASWLPTRSSGQTTASMVVQLQAGRSRQWFTGTSSPCLSVFKPVGFAGDPRTLAVAGDRPDESLWWRHERLHRVTLGDDAVRRATFAAERAALETRALAVDPEDDAAVAAIWTAHHEALPRWTAMAAATGRPGWRPFHRYWAHKARLAGA